MAVNSSEQAFYLALLRPTVLHILRATGFQSTKQTVLDTAVDLTARFLALLAEKTVAYASSNLNLVEPTLTEVRLAMEDAGCFVPSVDATEEAGLPDEDLRGLNAFIDWCKGEQNQEIRRIAGMEAKEGLKVEVGGLGDGEDFLAVLKKRMGKVGDESRYIGTVLGDGNEERVLKIEGADIVDLTQWGEHVRQTGKAPIMPSYASSASALSSPPEELDNLSDQSDQSEEDAVEA